MTVRDEWAFVKSPLASVKDRHDRRVDPPDMFEFEFYLYKSPRFTNEWAAYNLPTVEFDGL